MGKNQLTKLVASGGIVYQENGGNEFAGDILNFNATDNYMTISGKPDMPCMLNGVFVKGIEYDINSGEARPSEQVGVGIMPVKE
ncbi:MAG TPA: hypothetical protein DCP47_03670 [Phycisphaerales bacterium]|nr:hypothetical protein [Phycisphaerales bacterium]